MFHEGNLQSGIALAVQQSKAVLCFVHGNSQKSRDWEEILANDEEIHESLTKDAICLRMKVVSRETVYLSSFCPIKTTPAIVVIHNGQLALSLQGSEMTVDDVKERLRATFPSGRPGHNLPVPPSNPLPQQTAAPPVVSTPTAPLSPPAATTSSPAVPPTSAPTHVSRPSPAAAPDPNQSGSDANREDGSDRSRQAQQREDYVKMQKEREQKQRDERERIKQQIKSDREERRRVEELHKQTAAAALAKEEAALRPAKSNDIRVQVRIFDGSRVTSTFPLSATISNDIRPWIDSSLGHSSPYNLKLILTPLPNRNIEAGEEEQPLPDLGIKGSCTMVMVPIKGAVDSYTESGSGLIGSAVSTGYSLVTSTAGAVFGGVKSVLGYGNAAPSQPDPAEERSTANSSEPKMRVRTLADQRAEDSKKNQQFYNGNQLNFQPRRDEDGGKDD